MCFTLKYIYPSRQIGETRSFETKLDLKENRQKWPATYRGSFSPQWPNSDQKGRRWLAVAGEVAFTELVDWGACVRDPGLGFRIERFGSRVYGLWGLGCRV